MQGEQITGKIALTMNGEHYICQFDENSKFATDLLRVMKRGKNPATALAFLSDFAVRTYYPQDFRCMRFTSAWNEFFGTMEGK